jgi:AraC-like DNA-binding protein
VQTDPLSDILQVLKPRAYGFRGVDVSGEWSLQFAPYPAMRCYAVRSGECRLWLDGSVTPVHLAAGDFVLLPQGQGVVLGSRAGAPRIDLDRLFETSAGDTATFQGGGEFSGLGGYFEMGDMASTSLLAALPSIVHLRAGADASGLVWLVERLMAELREPRPGGRLIAEHLSQTLLVEALRLHSTTADDQTGNWLTALADPRLSRAIEAMHAAPGERWTLDALARVAGMSRSAFAERFTVTCGEPAIAYLARWRMLLASDRLSHGIPIATIARDLGYGSESAFGAAFRRIMGRSPGRHRTAGSADQR